MKTNSEIKIEGYNALVKALGTVYAEKFITLLQQEPFDYTIWQGNLWTEKGIEELSKDAMNYINNTRL